jgi:hypothetical protein
MKEPERVNVMLSRARCGLIMLGSKRCLMNYKSVKGRILWTKFFQLMQCDGRAVLFGLLVQCKHHPETKRYLNNTKDFDRAADGGCDLPCVVKLKCGHVCPLKCHPGDDHVSVLCAVQHNHTCQKGHILDYFCGNGPKPCKMCAVYVRMLRQTEYAQLQMQRRQEQYLRSWKCSKDSRKYESGHDKLW